MFKLVLEKAEEPEIKLPTSVGSSKKKRVPKKHFSFCFIDYAKAFDCVDHKKLWKILQEMRIPLEKPICRSGCNRTGRGQQTGSKQEKENVKAVYCHPAYLTSRQSTS